MTVSEVLREANRIAEKELEIFHRAMKSLQDDQRRIGNMKVSMNKKYITKNGDKVRLLCVDRDTPYSVVALIGTDSFIETFTDKGRRNALGSHPRDLVEIPELEDFQIDDPVMVRVKGGCWMKRYFAKVGDDGAPMTWLGGATSWSSDGLISWDECRLPTKEELGGWTHKRKHDVETTK